MLGEAIWDDYTLIFNSEVLPRYKTLLVYQWPLFRYTILAEIKLFSNNFLLYHLFNITIHLINGWLFTKLLKKLKVKYTYPLVLLFLFHPVNIESILWINQIKTLLAFTFFMIFFNSMMDYIKSPSRHKSTIALLSYLISILFKSSAIISPLIFSACIYKAIKTKQEGSLLFIIQFLLGASLLSIFLVRSLSIAPINTERDYVESRLIANSFVNISKDGDGATELFQHNSEINIYDSIDNWQDLTIRVILFLKTTNHYLKKMIFPINLSPVYQKFSLDFHHFWRDFSMLFILTLLFSFFIYKKMQIPWLLLTTTSILLIPFVGFIIPPYMYLTYVADRHLYFVLPFFILSIYQLVSQNNIFIKTSNKVIKVTSKITAIFVLCIMFVFSFNHAHYFKNDELFWGRVAHQAPHLPLSDIYLGIKYKQNCNVIKSHHHLDLAIKKYHKNSLLSKDTFYDMLIYSRLNKYSCPKKITL